MTKQKSNVKKITDFFGSKNEYFIFAMKSDLQLLAFAHHLGEKLKYSFSYLYDNEIQINNQHASFHVMYNRIIEEQNIHCYIIENKTTRYHKLSFIESKKEKNCSFQTLSLFEEYFYIFNSQGFSFFPCFFSDFDYLIFAFADKESNFSDFTEKMLSFPPKKCIEITEILYVKKDKKEVERANFLQDLFCTLELKSSEQNQENNRKGMFSRFIIPKENLTEQLHNIDENITKILSENFNKNYCRLLTDEE